MIIQPMSVSDQIIAVINDLCAKFGVAIDWSAENILPYIKDICERYIKFELYNSIAWCVIMGTVLLIIAVLWFIAVVLYNKNISLDRSCCEFLRFAFYATLIASIIVWAFQTFDIIECYTIPEKTILEYLKTLLRSANASG